MVGIANDMALSHPLILPSEFVFYNIAIQIHEKRTGVCWGYRKLIMNICDYQNELFSSQCEQKDSTINREGAH